MKKPRIGIIGAGLIGSALYKKLKIFGWDISFILRRNGIYRDLETRIDDAENYLSYCKDVDLVFLAIPTADDGFVAFEYITGITGLGVPIVTCEKGALANYFSGINQNLVGCAASVGGGSRLLEYLRTRAGDNTREIHAVVNGTLNYFLTELARGEKLDHVAKQAVANGFAEPGAIDPLAIINQEACRDVPMKCAILANVSGLASEYVRAKDIVPKPLDWLDLRELAAEAKQRRFIVSLTRSNANEDMMGGFKYRFGDWHISAGFKNIGSNPIFRELIVDGPTNALVIVEGGDSVEGVYKVSGPGAGAGPTTTSILLDAKKLLKI